MTHQRRSKGNAGKTVTFTGDTPVTMKKDQFLANRQNKKRFISTLSEELAKKNCETHHASGDANLLIVQKAVLVGDDTDLLVLLCYHASLESHDLFFCPEPKKNTKQPCTWNIKAVKQRLGPDMCQHILFLHAFLGCDTTSRLHGIGKGASLKKYQTNNSFREQAMVLHSRSASTHDVTRAGERALVIIYNGRSTDTLDSFRHQRFREKVASSATHVHPQTLPPTSGAAKYHSMRVYLQVQEWKGSADGLIPTEWGWQLCDEEFVPLQTALAPAPDNLLRVIRCSCLTDCSSLRRTCKKHNIECTPACGNCRGSGCTNSLQMACDDDRDDDDAYI